MISKIMTDKLTAGKFKYKKKKLFHSCDVYFQLSYDWCCAGGWFLVYIITVYVIDKTKFQLVRKT